MTEKDWKTKKVFTHEDMFKEKKYYTDMIERIEDVRGKKIEELKQEILKLKEENGDLRGLNELLTEELEHPTKY